jgi:hypothetical protein
MVMMAENLFNLQHVDGINSRLSLLANSDFLSVVNELDAARLVVKSGLAFAFNSPQGQKGRDFEGNVILPSGRRACIEVKMKRHCTSISQKTILESLKSAIKQVPDEPTIILLGIPDRWVTEPTLLEPAVDAANRRFFGRSGRVIAVVYFWEEWDVLPNGTLCRSLRYREFSNERSRYFDRQDQALIKPWEVSEDGVHWFRFCDLLARSQELGARSQEPVGDL